MRSHVPSTRLVFLLIHRLLVVVSLVLLGTGWYLRHSIESASDWTAILDFHISLGLTSVVLVLVQASIGVVFLLFRPPEKPDRRRTGVSVPILCLTYSAIVFLAVTGILEARAAATPIRVWGIPLPPWLVIEVQMGSALRAAHGFAAYVLIGSIFLEVGFGSRSRRATERDEAPLPLPTDLDAHRPISRLPVASDIRSAVAPETARKLAQNLAGSLRLFGWIEVVLQATLALIVGLLLTFATSGHVFSPSALGLGDPIRLAWYGFSSLIPSVALAFYATRVGPKIVTRPESYLDHRNKLAFWFLKVSLVVGFVGVIVSFAGIALSISLLIAKSISHPPGLAITEPHRIIRPLDIFVLIVNFVLLIAHFVGTAATLWLGLAASKARVDYMAARTENERKP